MTPTTATWPRIWKAAALGVCLYASWAAWRGPPPRTIQDSPAPLPRNANLATLQDLQQTAAALTQQAQQSQAGSSTGNLESLLNEPIPDNPLVEGVGTTAAWCGRGLKPIEVDWIFCPDTGTVTAGLPAQ
jgi:hypothetical protein